MNFGSITGPAITRCGPSRPAFELCKFADAFPDFLAPFLSAAIAAVFYRSVFVLSIGD